MTFKFFNDVVGNARCKNAEACTIFQRASKAGLYLQYFDKTSYVLFQVASESLKS
jgi:hypothetical protein